MVAATAGFARGIWVPNLHNGLLALAFSSVGCYVLHQQPRNRCGAAFLATGVVEAVMFLGRQIGHDAGSGTSPWWGWLGVWPLVIGLALVTLSVILFPDGVLPSPGWRWVVRVGAVLTLALAVTSALWPVGETAAVVRTAHPFVVPGATTAGRAWDIVARPIFVAYQVVWLAAVADRWRTSGPVVRRQLVVVGAATAISLVALAGGLVWSGTPTAGVLAVCLLPAAAGWSILHGQFLATHSALTWMARRSGGADTLPAELARAIADALGARHVVVWARRANRYHAVGMWPEPVEQVVPVNHIGPSELAADLSAGTIRLITRGSTELGAVVLDRPHPLSRHDDRVLDGFCGQAAVVLEHLAAVSMTVAASTRRDLGHLTPRELEVLDLMAQGFSNSGICERLHLSIKTVEPAVSSIFTKLDLPPGGQSNRRVLAVLAYVDNQKSAHSP